MRTDRLKLLTGLFLAAGLTAGPATGVRAQDTLEPPTAESLAPRRTGDRVVVNGDLTVARGEVIEGRAVVMRGHMTVLGTVTGDVSLGAGDLTVAPGGKIGGHVRISHGSLVNRGSIGGDARVVGGRITNEGSVGGEMRADDLVGANTPTGTNAAAAARVRGWFGDGANGLFSTLVLGGVLALVGGALVFYGLPQLRTVSESIRGATVRVGAIGLAASVLVVPAFVVMVVILVATIIGIPLLLVAAPLYPVAVVAAAAFGVVAVAHAIGEKTAEQRPGTDPRRRNAYAYVFTGLAVLVAPLLAANALRMMGVPGMLGDALEFFSGMLLWVAAIVGAGAVVYTRFGTRPPVAPLPFDPVFDRDPLFDDEPAGTGTHV